MVEGLGLGLGRWRCSQRRLGLGGGVGLGQEGDLLIDGAAQVVERLADVGWVVIGLVGVLGAGSRKGSSPRLGQTSFTDIHC